ncbi:MAG: amidohydrolase, partial [Cytophagales bacterium]
AGTSAAHGLDKESALATVTSNTAKILGIDTKVGTLEVGKEATLVVSEGDILDMRTSKVVHAFVRGKKLDLNDKQKELYEKYKKKYSGK